MAGTLYLVATPIGNLEDLTFRALRVMKECALIACEDTRHSRKLLDHYGIAKPLVSYHDHNEAERSPEIIERLTAGDDVALLSDAGTPLVADPGYRLVTAAIAAGVAVVPLPGPSATVAALAASGLPTDTFRFGGFLPAKSTQRAAALEAVKDDPATLIFYEAPHRILEALEDLVRIMPGRPVVVARELTKTHEEFLRGSPAEILAALAQRGSVKGEITLLIGKRTKPAAPPEGEPVDAAVAALVREGMPRMDAIKAVARRYGLSKREIYQQVESTKKD